MGNGNQIDVKREIHFPHSLGLLYSAFTYYIGFKVNSGEYKVMGLAPYGSPRFAEKIKEKLIRTADDGSFQLDMSYFGYPTSLHMTTKKFHDLFGGPPRTPESVLTQRDMDLAASIQKVIEEAVVRLGRSIAEETGEKNLCLAGGVALNCVANGVLLREKIFENIWIQPAAGDAGGAIGAALYTWYQALAHERVVRDSLDSMNGGFLGPAFSNDQIESVLREHGASYQKFSEDELLDRTATILAKGQAVGWFQGRMEFGPRALGGRSIIADPRAPEMQRKLNLKIKFRESFRPFAPSILKEEVKHWFENEIESPYMLFVEYIKQSKRYPVNENEASLEGLDRLRISRSAVPAVTHIDYSARLQTVDELSNSKFYNLIHRFYRKTGVPILANTSFNVRGEPLVCDPHDAYRCFLGTDLDALIIGDFILLKSEQNIFESHQYAHKYELD